MNKKYRLIYYKGYMQVEDLKGKAIARKRVNSNLKSNFLVRRALRLTPRAAISIDDNTFIVCHDGKILRYEVDKNLLIIEHVLEKGMKNPLCFTGRYDSELNQMEVLFGEYIWNADKGPVSIYKREAQGWSIIYTFPAGRILHIHNIIFDSFRNRYLILTGDSDSESGIWEANIDFSSVKLLAGGSQKYRACILMPTNDALYYVTDTPLQQNFVYKLKINGEIEEIAEISGPCIYGIEKNRYLYFATSVEGDPTLGVWKYRLSDKLGLGVKDRYSHLYRLSQYGNIQEISKVEKDMLPMWLFEFGNMKFPRSDDDKVYVCPQSLKTKCGTYVIEE